MNEYAEPGELQSIGARPQEDQYNRMTEFIKELLDPEMFGWAVTQEVRDRARKVLLQAPAVPNLGSVLPTVSHS